MEESRSEMMGSAMVGRMRRSRASESGGRSHPSEGVHFDDNDRVLLCSES